MRGDDDAQALDDLLGVFFGDGLAFEVREGDLVRANRKAQDGPHVLVLDEINRADLAKVLGEAIFLFEPERAGKRIGA